MSKKAAFDVKTLILCAIIIVGLILTIVGFVGNFLQGEASGSVGGLSGSTKSDPIKLSDIDKDAEFFTVTNVCAWVTFILAIVVTVLFAVAKFLGIKQLNVIVALAGCLTVVAAILVFIFAIVMASKNSGGASVLGGLASGSVKYTISAGPILMLAGGLLAGGAAAASAKI